MEAQRVTNAGAQILNGGNGTFAYNSNANTTAPPTHCVIPACAGVPHRPTGEP